MDCIVALPGQLFRSTQIPACLWFLSRGRQNGEHRNRRGETLFIDARKLGQMVDRTHRDLTPDEISRIADTYHAWRGGRNAGEYADVAGFCKSATFGGGAPARPCADAGTLRVGEAPQEDDGEPFGEKMARLAAQWREQQAEAARLDAAIEENLKSLGFGTGQDSRAEG